MKQQNKYKKYKAIRDPQQMRKVVKEFSATLTTCGQKGHKKGCYLRLTGNKIDYSDDNLWIVVDFDKNDKIVGIEFVEGLG